MAKLLRARWLLIPVVLVLIIAAYAGWRYLSQWESTDDAQIEGHIHPVNAKVGGTITSVNVRDNQPVEAGTVLVQLDARDYEIAVARAKADLSEAQAGVIAARAGFETVSVSMIRLPTWYDDRSDVRRSRRPEVEAAGWVLAAGCPAPLLAARPVTAPGFRSAAKLSR